MENRISIEIPPAVIQKVEELIASINSELAPYLPDIPESAIGNMPKMADGREPFTSKALDFAEKDSQFNPPFMDVAELRKDLQAYRDLTPIFYSLEQITSRVKVAYTIAGSEAYTTSLTFYNTIKQAVKVGVGGAKVIYEALRILFEKKPKPVAK